MELEYKRELVSVNKTEDDVKKLLAVLEDVPDDVGKLFELGVAYLSLKKVNEAEKVFKQCLQFNKEHHGALGNLGIVYLLKGKPKKSIKHLRKCLKIDPSYHEIWLSLGSAYLMMNKTQDAIEAIEHSLAIKSNNRDALVALARVYSNMESWKESLKILGEADKFFPNDYEIHKVKAYCLMKQGRTEELEEVYRAMWEIDSEDDTMPMYLGQLAMRKGKIDEGLAYYRKSVEMNPDSFMGWRVLADALKKLGMEDEAREAHEKFKEIEANLKKDGPRIF